MSILLHEERDACGLSLIVSADIDPINPRRDFDPLGTMICWHRRYDLGDPHSFGSPAEFDSEMETRPHIKLPVYLYDHSGLTVSTIPFSCPWDSGQIGWIFIEKIKLRAELSKSTQRRDLQAEAEALLRAEVTEYDQYLTGDVCCARVENRAGEIHDSCSGFYGSGYAITKGCEMLANCVAVFRQEQAEAFVGQIESERPDLTPPGL